MLFQFQVVEEEFQFSDRQINQLRYVTAAYPYISGFRFQAGSMTLRAECFATIAGKHHAVLYFVLVLLYHFEESIDSFKIGSSFPQHSTLLIGQFKVGSENRQTGFFCTMYYHITPFTHLVTSPTNYSSIVYR